MLHVLNGDATREKLERANVPGVFAVWADVLHEGPVPGPDASDEEFRAVRARYHSRARTSHEEAHTHLQDWDAALAAYPGHEEVVLWFEHDLFDQVLLIRHLDWFARQPEPPRRLGLICIGAFPGHPDFMGLGELSPGELATLLPQRAEVGGDQLAAARAAWRAFTSSDPRELHRIAHADGHELPFLGAALRRWLEELPWTRDGLSLTQRRLLQNVAAGTAGAVDLFRANNTADRVFYLGDSSFGVVLEELAGGASPAIRIEERGERRGALPRGIVCLTDFGRALLDGRADWVRDHGVDRWMGGVHLHGRAVPWRWDAGAQRVAESGV